MENFSYRFTSDELEAVRPSLYDDALFTDRLDYPDIRIQCCLFELRTASDPYDSNGFCDDLVDSVLLLAFKELVDPKAVMIEHGPLDEELEDAIHDDDILSTT